MTRKKVVPQEWRLYLDLIAPKSDYTQWGVVEKVLAHAPEDVTLDQTTVSNWRNGKYTPPRPAVVAAVAAAFGREPLEALVAAGHVELDWVTASLSSNALDTLKKIGVTPTKRKRAVAVV